MGYEWQTIEEAAVTLGISTRTLARRIAQGQVENRLQNGRRELFICIPDQPQEAPPEPAYQSPPPFIADAQVVDAQQSVCAPASENLSTDLILAEDRAHRAEMTLRVIQQSVQLVQSEAHRARTQAYWAWGIVALLGLGLIVRVGWAAARITRSTAAAAAQRDRADDLHDRLAETQSAAQLAQKESTQQFNRLQDELSKAQSARAQVTGQLEQMHSDLTKAEQRVAEESRRAQALEAAARTPPTSQPAGPTEHASVGSALVP